MNKKYLIIYDWTCFKVIKAESAKQCIEVFAKLFNDAPPTFIKAMSGIDTVDEAIDLFSRFSNKNIQAVVEIADTLYDEDGVLGAVVEGVGNE